MKQNTSKQTSKTNGFHFPITVRLDDETLNFFNDFKESSKMQIGSAARFLMVEGLRKISSERMDKKLVSIL
jgi:hypothetical protein